MNRKFAIILLFAACLFCFGGEANAQATNEKVIETLKKYDEAWNKKDSPTVAKILADNYIYFTSKGGTTSRQDTLNFLISPKYIIKSAERSEIKFFQTAKTVIVSSRWKGNLTYDGEEINDDQRCSLVFAKNGKRWKLLSEHCTQIVSK